MRLTEAQTEALVGFAREMVRDAWEGCEGSIETLAIAERHGVVAKVPFDPVKHDDPAGICEAGDWWTEFPDWLKGVRALSQAEGGAE